MPRSTALQSTKSRQLLELLAPIVTLKHFFVFFGKIIFVFLNVRTHPIMDWKFCSKVLLFSVFCVLFLVFEYFSSWNGCSKQLLFHSFIVSAPKTTVWQTRLLLRILRISADFTKIWGIMAENSKIIQYFPPQLKGYYQKQIESLKLFSSVFARQHFFIFVFSANFGKCFYP